MFLSCLLIFEPPLLISGIYGPASHTILSDSLRDLILAHWDFRRSYPPHLSVLWPVIMTHPPTFKQVLFPHFQLLQGKEEATELQSEPHELALQPAYKHYGYAASGVQVREREEGFPHLTCRWLNGCSRVTVWGNRRSYFYFSYIV